MNNKKVFIAICLIPLLAFFACHTEHDANLSTDPINQLEYNDDVFNTYEKWVLLGIDHVKRSHKGEITGRISTGFSMNEDGVFSTGSNNRSNSDGLIDGSLELPLFLIDYGRIVRIVGKKTVFDPNLKQAVLEKNNYQTVRDVIKKNYKLAKNGDYASIIIRDNFDDGSYQESIYTYIPFESIDKYRYLMFGGKK